MSAKTFVAVLSLFSLAQGAAVLDDRAPERPQGGIFGGSLDSSHQFHGEKIGNITEVERRYVPLPISSSGCSSGSFQQAELERAKYSFQQHCGKGKTLQNNVEYASYGDVDVFVCNYGGQNNCDSDEIQYAMDYLHGKCGNSGGWVYMKDWKKTYGSAAHRDALCNGNMPK